MCRHELTSQMSTKPCSDLRAGLGCETVALPALRYRGEAHHQGKTDLASYPRNSTRGRHDHHLVGGHQGTLTAAPKTVTTDGLRTQDQRLQAESTTTSEAAAQLATTGPLTTPKTRKTAHKRLKPERQWRPNHHEKFGLAGGRYVQMERTQTVVFRRRLPTFCAGD